MCVDSLYIFAFYYFGYNSWVFNVAYMMFFTNQTRVYTNLDTNYNSLLSFELLLSTYVLDYLK